MNFKTFFKRILCSNLNVKDKALLDTGIDQLFEGSQGTTAPVIVNFYPVGSDWNITDWEQQPEFRADKTYGEVLEAFHGHQAIIGRVTSGNNIYLLEATAVLADGDGIQFFGFASSYGEPIALDVNMLPEGGIFGSSFQFKNE